MEAEKDDDQLLADMRKMTERMKWIGRMAKNFVDSVEANSEALNKEGGKDQMAMRAMRLDKNRPEETDKIRDEYTAACHETMKHVVELLVIAQDMTQQFMDLPEEKKKHAAKMN